MSEEKKTAVPEEVKEEVRKLTEEELEQVNGGAEGALRMGKTIITSGMRVGSLCN